MSWGSAAATKVQQSHSMQAQDSPTDRVSALEVDHGNEHHDSSQQQPENGPAPEAQALHNPRQTSRPSAPTSSATGLATAPGHAVWADANPSATPLCALPAEPEALLGMVLYVVSTLAMSAQSTVAKVLGEVMTLGGQRVISVH